MPNHNIQVCSQIIISLPNALKIFKLFNNIIIIFTHFNVQFSSYILIYIYIYIYIYISAGQRLITSKLYVFVYVIYVCVLCIFIIYIYTYTFSIYVENIYILYLIYKLNIFFLNIY